MLNLSRNKMRFDGRYGILFGVCVVIAICIASAVAVYGLLQSEAASYYSDISVSEISDVVHLKADEDLPEWIVNKVQKYDDGFVTPSVIVQYKNGVVLRLSDSQMSYSIDNHEQIQMGDHLVTRYKDADKTILCTTLHGASYCFEIPFQRNVGWVEQFILNIKDR